MRAREICTEHQLMLRSVTHLHFLISIRDSDHFKPCSQSVALKRKFSRCWCVANIIRFFHFSFGFILMVVLAERVKNMRHCLIGWFAFVWFMHHDSWILSWCHKNMVTIFCHLIQTKCFSSLINFNITYFLFKIFFSMAKRECLTPSQFPTHTVRSLNLIPHDRKPKW